MSRGTAEALALVEAAEELEAKYDGALGGEETRPYRDLLGYCAGKLVMGGAEPGDVLVYLQEVLSLGGPHLVQVQRQIMAALEADPAKGGA